MFVSVQKLRVVGNEKMRTLQLRVHVEKQVLSPTNRTYSYPLFQLLGLEAISGQQSNESDINNLYQKHILPTTNQ